ncbi:MAG: DegV family protein [Oscillospiraceae bacterium]|nr:DegV family protein [Oscillospiraceae bacterium]
MSKYVIIVDSSADLPYELYEKNDIICMPIMYVVEGEEYPDDAGRSMAYTEFYKRVRGGVSPTTSMINTAVYTEEFEKHLKNGIDILCMPLSSGISGSYNAAKIAESELREKYPERKLFVVDSIAASMGHGLLACYAAAHRDNGMPVEELAKWVEENKRNIIHLFTVDDLMHLQRGGRISKASAVVGSLIGVKPMLDIDGEGRLRVHHKKRGRKGALDDLVDWMGESTDLKEFDLIAVSHGDCEADADYIIEKVKGKYKIGKVLKNFIGPVIGSHAGPGTVTLFFMGKERV